MTPESWKETLSKAGVQFETGLSAAELRRAEEMHEFVFPEDLAELLRFALPVSGRWPNWREPGNPDLLSSLNWPLEGILFDIENDVFWMPEWGERPAALGEAFAIAREHVSAAPRLIPICSHRYLPAEPCERGNPVFSAYQTDIIYYGGDLTEYFGNEFSYYFRGPNVPHVVTEPTRRIEFWSLMVERN